MSTPNPYQAPQSSITPPPLYPGELPLASPWIRLGAYIIDVIVLIPIGWVLAKFLYPSYSGEEIMELSKKLGVEGALAKIRPGLGSVLLVNLISLAIFLGVNFVFLKKGQTVGKMATKLQIQNRADGSLLSLQDIVVKRILPLYALSILSSAFHWSISLVISLILIADVLCIFRAGRNTLHDDVAGTKVVKLPS